MIVLSVRIISDNNLYSKFTYISYSKFTYISEYQRLINIYIHIVQANKLSSDLLKLICI